MLTFSDHLINIVENKLLILIDVFLCLFLII